MGKTRKVSKRVQQMWNDPETVWGKNPKLEAFWNDLAAQKNVVLIYKDKTHKYVKQKPTTIDKCEEDNNIVAILSSNPSQDAYEVYLYPKAKDKSVEYVIKNYSKYFKPILPGKKLRVPL